MQNSNSFQWQKKFAEHSHLLTLIRKINKNFSWKCNKCSLIYKNEEASFYCSLCDYYICRKCMEGKRIDPAPIILFPQIYNDFQFKSFKILLLSILFLISLKFKCCVKRSTTNPNRNWNHITSH